MPVHPKALYEPYTRLQHQYILYQLYIHAPVLPCLYYGSTISRQTASIMVIKPTGNKKGCGLLYNHTLNKDCFLLCILL